MESQEINWSHAKGEECFSPGSAFVGVSVQTQTDGRRTPIKPEVAMGVKVMDRDMMEWGQY